MAIVTISSLFTPEFWILGTRERQAALPSLLNSGVATRNATMDGIASGAGTSVNVPFFKDITDQTDEIQVEDTAPTTVNGITTGLQVAPIMNRVTKNSATALAGAVSGTDPYREMADQIAARRLMQRQATLLAILRALFGSATTINGAAALSACRLGGTTAENCDESGTDATEDQLMNPDMWIDGKALLGELSSDLGRGVFWCHSNIKARLEKLDALNFKTNKPSDLPFELTTYRDVPIFVSDSLVRAGTTNGYVYDSYLLTRGCVGYGEKPQVAINDNSLPDVASFAVEVDRDKNNVSMWDRTRFAMLLAGTKWVGTAAGQSATNTELQTTTNWELVYSSAARCGAVCIRTNG